MFVVSKVEGGEQICKYLHRIDLQCKEYFYIQVQVCDLSDYISLVSLVFIVSLIGRLDQ